MIPLTVAYSSLTLCAYLVYDLVPTAHYMLNSKWRRGQQNVSGLVNLEFALYQRAIRRLQKKISLKVSSNLRQPRAVSLSSGALEEHAAELDFPDIENFEPIQQDDPQTSTRYKTRREKEFDSWKEIRESLLTSSIEEEEFNRDRLLFLWHCKC